jgi:hypothetical protein
MIILSIICQIIIYVALPQSQGQVLISFTFASTKYIILNLTSVPNYVRNLSSNGSAETWDSTVNVWAQAHPLYSSVHTNLPQYRHDIHNLTSITVFHHHSSLISHFAYSLDTVNLLSNVSAWEVFFLTSCARCCTVLKAGSGHGLAAMYCRQPNTESQEAIYHT